MDMGLDFLAFGKHRRLLQHGPQDPSLVMLDFSHAEGTTCICFEGIRPMTRYWSYF
jgi:hypothetical protein